MSDRPMQSTMTSTLVNSPESQNSSRLHRTDHSMSGNGTHPLTSRRIYTDESLDKLGAEVPEFEPAYEERHGGKLPQEDISQSEKKQTSGLISKIFKRQSSHARKELYSIVRQSDPMPQQESTSGLGVPSPFTDPLAHKLRPRSEKAFPDIDTEAVPDPDAPMSAITIARHRGEAARILTSRISDDESEVSVRPADLNSFIAASRVALPTSKDPASKRRETQNSRGQSGRPGVLPALESSRPSDDEMGHIIAAVARDERCVEQWIMWLLSYGKGHFNLTTPPQAPPLSSSFKFLPSVRPPHEEERMAMSRQYRELLPEWGRERASGLIRHAMSTFKTSYVSLSLFDSFHEVFVAENGYNQPQVERNISISAHVLLSKDVLVVLDATKDWRFSRNPLVIGKPHIRFFAGAPMMSPSGRVLGVFAIFGRKARSSFNHTKCRQLAEFSSVVMEDLRSQINTISTSEHCLTPLVQSLVANRSISRSSTHSSRARSSASGYAGSIDSQPLPCTVHYQMPDYIPSGISRLNQTQNGLPGPHTPPTTAESNTGFLQHSNDLETQVRLSGSSYLAPGISIHTYSPNGLHGIRVSTPRPFSSSDLTSLYLHPPNTPDHSATEDELSTVPKYDLSPRLFNTPVEDDEVDASYQSLPSTGTVTVATPSKSTHVGAEALLGDDAEENHQQQISDAFVTFDTGVVPTTLESSLVDVGCSVKDEETSQQSMIEAGMALTAANLPRTPVSSLVGSRTLVQDTWTSQSMSNAKMALKEVGSSPLIDLATPPAQHNHDHMADASFACASTAQALGYDVMYVVEIKPVRAFMSEAELQAPSGLEARCLIEYGLTEALEIEPIPHLRALRHGKANFYVLNQNTDMGPGFLVPVHSEPGPIELTRAGFVLGAFRKQRPVNTDDEDEISKHDIARLADFAEALKETMRENTKIQSTSSLEADWTRRY